MLLWGIHLGCRDRGDLCLHYTFCCFIFKLYLCIAKLNTFFFSSDLKGELEETVWVLILSDSHERENLSASVAACLKVSHNTIQRVICVYIQPALWYTAISQRRLYSYAFLIQKLDGTIQYFNLEGNVKLFPSPSFAIWLCKIFQLSHHIWMWFLNVS